MNLSRATLLVFLAGASCVRAVPLPEPVEPQPMFADEVKPILELRCMVCHACYNAPCQLNLQSYEGLDRGGNEHSVYESTRITAVAPTRMFQDALTTADWVKRFKFFPVVSHNKRAADSLLYHFVLKRRADGRTVGDYDADKAGACPDSVEKARAYLDARPEAGMPYGFPALDDAQFKVIERWLEAGAPPPLPGPAAPAATIAAIAKWEAFLNQDPLRNQLVSRYLYEHLFLAHIHFSRQTRDFYRLVRSRTAAPAAVDEIVTVRPYDDPQMGRVHYRFVRNTQTIVSKTHVPFELNDAKLDRFQKLFLAPKWSVAALPSWERDVAANPFVTFAAIPARARYQFMLDDAHYHVRAFIHGPVCRGQVALNVIDEHFWIMFTAPEADLAVIDPPFLAGAANDLGVPAAGGSGIEAFYARFKVKQLQYVKQRNALYDREGKGRALADLWDGDGFDRSAVLTVYRHFDSASVSLGALGGIPKTGWVMDYPIFERIYYDLVGGFDVFGNIVHQVSTRQYMDNLRVESEDGFLQFLPLSERPKLRAHWYRGDGLDSYMAVINPLVGTARESRVVFKEPARAKEELWAQVKSKLLAPAVLGSDRAPPAALHVLADVARPYAQAFPDLTYVRSGDETFSIIRNRGHANLAFMFKEEKYRIPGEDTIGVVRGQIGSYPNLFLVIPPGKLAHFVERLAALQPAGDTWKRFLDDFGVRRSAKDFWEHADWFNGRQVKDEPIDGGLLDLSRYLPD